MSNHCCKSNSGNSCIISSSFTGVQTLQRTRWFCLGGNTSAERWCSAYDPLNVYYSCVVMLLRDICRSHQKHNSLKTIDLNTAKGHMWVSISQRKLVSRRPVTLMYQLSLIELWPIFTAYTCRFRHYICTSARLHVQLWEDKTKQTYLREVCWFPKATF